MNNNGSYGAFWFEDCGAVTLGSNITYSGNEWPLSMEVNTFLDETSTVPASGNTNNDIRIVGGTLGGAATWHHFPGVDYIITAIPTISASGSLSINDGNTVRFDYGNYFTVNGTLNATGTSGNGILFTRNGTAQWGGLRYYSGSTGTLEYCTVEHAIYGTGYAIFATDVASLTINNCQLQNNKYGFYGNNSSPHFLSNNQIINNNIDGIYLSGVCNPVFGNDSTQWNDIYGNGGYNINNNTSGDINANYVYWGTIDSTQIAATIYDYYDNSGLGIVYFVPWTNSAHNSLFLEFDLRIFLEGPFNGTDMNIVLNPAYLPTSQPYNAAPWHYSGSEGVMAIPNADIIDWVLIELRDATAPHLATASTMTGRKAVFLLNDGSVVDLDGNSNPSILTSPITNNLYVVVWHRNHLGIMSANPLTETEGVFTYDYTTSSGQAYGTDAQKDLGGGIFGLYQGNGNGDGFINEEDINSAWSSSGGEKGYYSGDFNLDSQVNNQDKDDFWFPNSGETGQVPE